MHEINALLHEIGVKGRFHRMFLRKGVDEGLNDAFVSDVTKWLKTGVRFPISDGLGGRE